MRKLLERTILSVDRRLVLLAPPGKLPSFFKRVEVDPAAHRRRVREMQALRGGVYLRDGAVQPQDLSADGLHQTPEDDQSWHVLMLNENQSLDSCIWYLEHENSVGLEDLRARHCPLALRSASRDTFRKAIETEIKLARQDGIKYAESGGWAVTERCRCSTEGLVLALAAFSLGNICGGVLALSTATSRHKSSEILRRMGGSLLSVDGEQIPSYFDPKYKCEMDLLRFDSRRPNRKYLGLVEMLRDKLAEVLVIARPAIAPVSELSRIFNPTDLAIRPSVAAA